MDKWWQLKVNLKSQGEYCHERKKATYSKHHFSPWIVGNVL